MAESELTGPALREALAEALGWRRWQSAKRRDGYWLDTEAHLLQDWGSAWDYHVEPATEGQERYADALRFVPPFETWEGMEVTTQAAQAAGYSVLLGQHRDAGAWCRLLKTRTAYEGSVEYVAVTGDTLPEALARALLLALQKQAEVPTPQVETRCRSIGVKGPCVKKPGHEGWHESANHYVWDRDPDPIADTQAAIRRTRAAIEKDPEGRYPSLRASLATFEKRLAALQGREGGG